jgi:hypothetical protein
VGPIEGLLAVQVVVMAETRQQAIEKARANLGAKLPEMLGQMFSEGDDRRFAQLGPDALEDRDILDNMAEVPDEVVISVVGLPVPEDGTDTPHTGAA